MSNSFTFKNPKRVGCYHSSKHNNMSFVVEYNNWHWRYEPLINELIVHIPLSPTKWLEALPEKHFTLQVQTPVYFFDFRKSYKRRPVYEKGNIDWEATKPDLMDVNIYKDNFNVYLSFKQKVDNFYGDGIMNIYQSMRGFWQEFKELLKQSKTCDPNELNNMLDSINCRLITYNQNSLTPTYINPAKISARYPKLQEDENLAIGILELPF